MKHPMQPIGLDANGVVRFQENTIIKWLFDTGQLDLNKIGIAAAEHGFLNDDQMQLAMLLGYSVSGFGDLDYADPAVVAKADELAEKLLIPSAATD